MQLFLNDCLEGCEQDKRYRIFGRGVIEIRQRGIKAYSWASFVFLYGQFRKPCSDEDDPKDKVRNKLKHYNLMLSYCNLNGEQYQKLKKEKEEWLKSLHLDECKIVDKL